MSRRTPGKIIDETPVHGGGREIIVQLRLIKESGYDCRKDNIKFSYLAHAPEGLKQDITGDDANAVRKQAVEEIRKYLEVKWEPMLHVEVEFGDENNSRWGSSREDLGVVNLEFKYRALEYATNSEGKHIHREPGDSFVRDDWPTEGRHPRGAAIPDTPINRAKLASIHDQLLKLGTVLTEFLSQAKIGKTLEQTAIKLLTMSEDK